MTRTLLILLLTLPLALKANDPNLEFRVTINFSEESINKQTSVQQEVDTLYKLTLTYLKQHDASPLKNYSKRFLKAAKKGKLGSDKVDVLGFNSYWDADDFKKYLRENNYESAWMEAYFKSTKITIKDALTGTYDGYQERKEKPQYDEKGIYFRASINVYEYLNTTGLTKNKFMKELHKTLLSYPNSKLEPSIVKRKHLKKSIKKAEKLSSVVLPLRTDDYWELDSLKKYLRSKGYLSTWLLAFKDGTRTPIKEIAEELGW